MAQGTVVCSSSHVEELDDGRWLHPGEIAENVNLGDEHIAARIDAKAFTVVERRQAEHKPAAAKPKGDDAE